MERTQRRQRKKDGRRIEQLRDSKIPSQSPAPFPPIPNLVHIDGRTLEGGGQLLRNALCLSALTGTPIAITDIRGNRSGGGGLKGQHLACVNWLARACNATVEGAEKGSVRLLFQPGRVEAGTPSPAFRRIRDPEGREVYESRVEIETAGSTGLLLQAVLPFVLFTSFPSPLPIRLIVRGGTNVTNSPSFDYFAHVLLPTLHRIGLPEITTRLERRGWSDGRGGSIGTFVVEIPARVERRLPAFCYGPAAVPTTRPSSPAIPVRLRAIFVAAQAMHSHCRSAMTATVSRVFGNAFDLEDSSVAKGSSPHVLQVTCDITNDPKRLYLLLIAEIPTTPSILDAHSSAPSSYLLARDHLQTRRIRDVEAAVTEMISGVTEMIARDWRSGGWVDEHMRDQLVVFQALAQGRSFVFPGFSEHSLCATGNKDEQVDGKGTAVVVNSERGVNKGGMKDLRAASLHTRTAEWIAQKVLSTGPSSAKIQFDGAGFCDGSGFGS